MKVSQLTFFNWTINKIQMLYHLKFIFKKLPLFTKREQSVWIKLMIREFGAKLNIPSAYHHFFIFSLLKYRLGGGRYSSKQSSSSDHERNMRKDEKNINNKIMQHSQSQNSMSWRTHGGILKPERWGVSTKISVAQHSAYK